MSRPFPERMARMSSPAPSAPRSPLARWLDRSAATAMLLLGAAFFAAVVMHALDPDALPWVAAAMVGVPLLYLSEAGALRRVLARTSAPAEPR